MGSTVAGDETRHTEARPAKAGREEERGAARATLDPVPTANSNHESRAPSLPPTHRNGASDDPAALMTDFGPPPGGMRGHREAFLDFLANGEGGPPTTLYVETLGRLRKLHATCTDADIEEARRLALGFLNHQSSGFWGRVNCLQRA